MAELKVLMMGGRRCGKTSALASIFYEMAHGQANKYLTLSDQTKPETKIDPITLQPIAKDSLNSKRAELEFSLLNAKGTFLVDAHPTNVYWDYLMQVQIPGTNRKMMINFRDAAGEYFESGNSHTEEVKQFVADCDVYLIMVDTPYVMGPIEEDSCALCPKPVSDLVNCVDDIHNFLTHIEDNEGKDAKMVIFVPIKCEKWAREGRLDEVTARVREVYDTTIQHLTAYKKMSIEILPIETVGNILFSEFREAMVIADGTTTQRCCKLGEKVVRLENGKYKQVRATDIVNEDPTAKLRKDLNYMRPYAWYTVNPQDSAYRPKNCDQLPLHILRFMIGKLKDSGQRIHSGDWFTRFWKRLRDCFGSIQPDELQLILSKMDQENLIKQSGDGISIIRKVF